jgi:transcriptional regulator with PAS, ATPase and Fis domain
MIRGPSSKILGGSLAILELQEEVDRVARSDAKVLITGESGSGKELIAREIHVRSPRSQRRFVPVNCAGLPETLLESELFGHVKGSFTGAYRDKLGKLEIAEGGTLFLDEVGDMTLRMQGLLLRFLETGELQKVGADRVHTKVDLRVIAATHRNLRDLIVKQQFREDLFYRLNVIHLVVPPLRERRDDIPLLIEGVMARHAEAEAKRVNPRGIPNSHGNGNGTGTGAGISTGTGNTNGNNGNGHGSDTSSPLQGPVQIAPAAMTALTAYSWPGNVRELENVMERLLVTCRREVAQLEDLPLEIRASQPGGSRPRVERRRTVADDLYQRLTTENESFWNAVYPLYMSREITRSNVRDLVRKGLTDARGNYKIVVRLFNMGTGDYKKFLNFLRKHDCQVPFKEFR